MYISKHFTYDANGTPLTVDFDYVYYMDDRTYDETTGTFLEDAEIGYTELDTYYYITNIQGDVIELLNSDGKFAGYYRYDAWGNNIHSDGGTEIFYCNPLRYRGYFLDPVSNLYYLQTRFYDPSVGRFISADAYVSTGQGVLGNNMFAYCLNNPVNFIDPSGMRCECSVRRVNSKHVCKDTLPDAESKNIWDYVVEYYERVNNINRQQQALDNQIRTEQIEVITSFVESDDFNKTKAAGKVVSGGKNIVDGAALILVPVPTITDDLTGVAKFTYGIINVALGIAQFVGECVK